jgi:phage shock protein E
MGGTLRITIARADFGRDCRGSIAGEAHMNALSRTFAIALLSFATVVAADAPPATIAADQLAQRVEKKDANLVVLDVRTPEEFAQGHIPGAVNIPHDQLPNRLAEIAGAKSKDVVVYCRSGRRATLAQQTLTSQGFTSVKHLEGDMLKWEQEQRPTAK